MSIKLRIANRWKSIAALRAGPGHMKTKRIEYKKTKKGREIKRKPTGWINFISCPIQWAIEKNKTFPASHNNDAVQLWSQFFHQQHLLAHTNARDRTRIIRLNEEARPLKGSSILYLFYEPISMRASFPPPVCLADERNRIHQKAQWGKRLDECNNFSDTPISGQGLVPTTDRSIGWVRSLLRFMYGVEKNRFPGRWRVDVWTVFPPEMLVSAHVCVCVRVPCLSMTSQELLPRCRDYA